MSYWKVSAVARWSAAASLGLLLPGCHVTIEQPRSCADGGDLACAHLNTSERRDDACWRCVDLEDVGQHCRLVDKPDGGACMTSSTCTAEQSCDDGLFCSGEETCVSGTCESSGNPCSGTTPGCDEENDVCAACMSDGDCDNGVFCDGAETCVNQGCVSAGEDPCAFLEAGTCSETTDRCLPPSRVFLTQTTTSLPLGQSGRSAYEDAVRECRWTGRGNLGPHFNSLPWFSVEGRAPVDVLLPLLGVERKFILPTGTPIASNWADLTDGSLNDAIKFQADYEEPPPGFAWTGTNSSGEHTGVDCEGWTQTSGSATIGDFGATDSAWTQDAAGGCGDARRFYCFEVFPQELSVKRVFLTSNSYRPGVDFSSVEDARQICESLGREAVDDESTQWDVWLSYDDSTGTPDPMADPAGRFTRHDGPYVSLNNHLVALDWDDLIDGDLIDRIDVDETLERHDIEGEEGDIYVWTGTFATGQSTPYDCEGWASSNSDDVGTPGGVTSAGQWWSSQGGVAEHTCDQAYRFYCLEQ